MNKKLAKGTLLIASNIQKEVDEILLKKEACYFCKKEFTEDDRGSFHVIINGKLVRAHKECYKRWKAEGRTNIRVIVK